MTSHVLGIDIGTSKVAAAMYSLESEEIVAVRSVPIADSVVPTDEGYSEQDVATIFAATDSLVQEFSAEMRNEVAALGVTGQMHGVVLWNPGVGGYSNLINWQDTRASRTGLLDTIQKRADDDSLRDGFGATSLGWLATMQPERLKAYRAASTVQGCFVSECVGADQGLIDASDAASWGLFDIPSNHWKTESFAALGVPERLLPAVLKTGEVAGSLQEERAGALGLPAGIKVCVSLGDNQASLFATIESPATDIAITLGTGGQLSVVIDAYPEKGIPLSVEIRPYIDGNYLAVSAALCGGSAFRWLVETVESWCAELGIPAPEESELYARLDALGLKGSSDTVKVCSSFLGERHAPDRRGSITNIGMKPLSLADLSASVAEALVANLHDMFPPELLEGRSRILGSGNAVRHLRSVQRCIEKVFGVPLSVVETQEEAASGAALLAARQLR